MITAVRMETPRTDDEIFLMKERLRTLFATFGVRQMTLASLIHD